MGLLFNNFVGLFLDGAELFGDGFGFVFLGDVKDAVFCIDFYVFDENIIFGVGPVGGVPKTVDKHVVAVAGFKVGEWVVIFLAFERFGRN